MQLPKWCLIVLMFLATGAARPALSHPMGNFSINHYARFEAEKGELKLRYALDFAEIPTTDQMARLDPNGDNKISAAEKSAYLQSAAPQFIGALTLQIDGRTVALAPLNPDLQVLAGAGGLPTLRVWMDATAILPVASASVRYEDANFAGRTGWMEVVARANGGLTLANSDAATQDQSRQLTVFPVDAGVVPPRQLSASFEVKPAGLAGTAPNSSAPVANTDAPVAATNNANTPQNRFTQSIAEHNLTPRAIIWGLLFAFGFGAIHALSPGHGKTMVAAYLVGTRGTPKHALALGLVVTITHTFGVFALGLAVLVAAQYVVPEKLYPALGALSGLVIFGVGLWLFMSRWQDLNAGHPLTHDGHTHDGHTHGDHTHDGHSHDGHSHDDHTHSHEHDGHSHDGEEHSHEGGALVHSHGGRAHSHAIPSGPITTKTLVALGISGGIVPCPEALVVLLAAIRLQRIGYGLVLITAFSVGLAMALIGIGLLVVSARQRLSRLSILNEGSPLTRYLPIGSAAAIIIIGAALTLQATLNR